MSDLIATITAFITGGLIVFLFGWFSGRWVARRGLVDRDDPDDLWELTDRGRRQLDGETDA